MLLMEKRRGIGPITRCWWIAIVLVTAAAVIVVCRCCCYCCGEPQQPTGDLDASLLMCSGTAVAVFVE